MGTIKKFEDLEIWKDARYLYQQLKDLIKIIRINKDFRFAEQIKSSSGSIMDNIAEGFERNSRREFIYSLGIASGECGEVKSQLFRCLDDEYISENEHSRLYEIADRVGKKIGAFIKYLNKSTYQGLKFKDRV